MKIKLLLMVGVLFLLYGCTQAPLSEPASTPVLTRTATLTPLSTVTPTKTLVPTATQVPTSTTVPTPTWAVVGPGEVIAPILLYHHIDPELNSPLYNVSPEQFAEQMQALADWGYTTITIAQLVEAINQGAVLPPRPIVITFDDGNHSVFQYAYPIMQQHGFVGVNYLVANRLQADGFMGVEELTELYKAGWEVGSHSYTHLDLRTDHDKAFDEIYHSRLDLAADLDQPVISFAYPFGGIDDYLGDRVGKWGYSAAVGLGKQFVHNTFSLYYLSRIEIKQALSLEEFGSLLPWSSPPN
ncbi:MAG: polysaccharide deacetylase family protein [Chloroflexota bacterium]